MVRSYYHWHWTRAMHTSWFRGGVLFSTRDYFDYAFGMRYTRAPPCSTFFRSGLMFLSPAPTSGHPCLHHRLERLECVLVTNTCVIVLLVCCAKRRGVGNWENAVSIQTCNGNVYLFSVLISCSVPSFTSTQPA